MVLERNGQEVIEACQRGDAEAFRVLFETHKDRVYSIALRYAGNDAAAMDIAQESFLKLLSTIRSFRGEAEFESWLYRLVVNCCLDHQRRGRRLTSFAAGLLDIVRSGADNALHQLMRAEEDERVHRVIANLPADQRIVIILRYTDGLSYDQIAEILGCSPGTVASRLNRAHKVLERRLSHLRGGKRV
jgi:RNA polymerase sigma-70 factor (ECF subfamily)